jgi:hypothetical protein
MTKPGALPRPEIGTSPLRKQLEASAKHQPFRGKLIHKKSFEKNSTFPNELRLS